MVVFKWLRKYRINMFITVFLKNFVTLLEKKGHARVRNIYDQILTLELASNFSLRGNLWVINKIIFLSSNFTHFFKTTNLIIFIYIFFVLFNVNGNKMHINQNIIDYAIISHNYKHSETFQILDEKLEHCLWSATIR